MAMRDLVDGDCGLTNPLMKIAGHFTHDKEQIGQQPYASAPDRLVKEFLESQGGGPHEKNVPQTFDMASLLQEMANIDDLYEEPVKATGAESINEAERWVQDYPETGEIGISAFHREQKRSVSSVDDGKSETPDTAIRKWAGEFLDVADQEVLNQDQVAGQWVQNYNVDKDDVQQVANELAGVMDEKKFSESKFMKFIKNVGEGKINLEENNTEADDNLAAKSVTDIWSTDFGSAWSPTEDVATTSDVWSKEFEEIEEFQTFTQTDAEKQEEEESDADFWDKLQREWEQMAKDEPAEHPWLTDFENFTEPYKDYTFTNENPLLDHSNPYEEGLKKLKIGDLPSAVLLFEAAVQKNPEHVEAWQYLGTSQAENEQDPLAIAALKRCLELDPENLTALLSLAVSYTNETLQSQACTALEKWLQQNPKYSHLSPLISDKDHKVELHTVSSILPSERHKAVRDIFIEAARMSPNDPDPDVQCALGVLFNLSGEYNKAVDCFKAALQIRPEDSLLWNRLGATLANGNRSEEAVVAYHNALELSPGFIRSRFNLGISCVNLGAVREAAEHFLTALNLQNAGRGPQGTRSKAIMSSNIWSTLRMVMTLLKRPDLYDLIERRDLDQLNKEFGMDA